MVSVDSLNKEAILRMLLSSYPNRPNVSPPAGTAIATVEVAGCECHFSIVMSDNAQIVINVFIENCLSCLNIQFPKLVESRPSTIRAYSATHGRHSLPKLLRCGLVQRVICLGKIVS